ncbi:Cof-type HAD-IIB family hydrolase [Streptococcus sp. DD12]|uniref:Cof-type HAD-IIB family hydrolase n=1 Tax=Streptococcus sp. DD12 TaxID=1777880 RepID=UPI0007976DD4|nr:Cof-type HAD-IIB family hydrolase [Streptococcus sp. DD12]KXT75487.1 Hydrolase (HAD superfamily) [Streptococcus sp. DD12]
MIKLVAIDMDGTLLDDKKGLSANNAQAIAQVAKEGVKVVICTGRQLSGVKPYYQQLGLTGAKEYAVLNNGCGIYQTNDWQLLEAQTLPHAELEGLLALSEPFPGVYLTLVGEHYDVVAKEVPAIVQADADLVFDQARAVSLSDIAGEQIFKAMYMAEPTVMDAFQTQVEEKLASDYSVVRSQPYLFEVLPKGVSKASGLKSLCQNLGIDLADVMAIGDAANDLEMLAEVGYPVAMGNASPEVKAIARYETKSNQADGVAYALQHWLGE